MMVSNLYGAACNQFVILSCTVMKRIHAVFTQSGVSDKEITVLQQLGPSTQLRLAQSSDYL